MEQGKANRVEVVVKWSGLNWTGGEEHWSGVLWSKVAKWYSHFSRNYSMRGVCAPETRSAEVAHQKPQGTRHTHTPNNNSYLRQVSKYSDCRGTTSTATATASVCWLSNSRSVDNRALVSNEYCKKKIYKCCLSLRARKIMLPTFEGTVIQ